ncbi:oxygen-dependent tRNA uridine(34) hydroxylase TrhO [Staphylococcus pettenkoferi]|uniref:tRNA uridine(34) hydroxylase n=1 Tax=Staphylococcus pettenkoferi TaxID=170573 RepID=A0ABT4BLK0_9STAP|nr:rhodanese-related sulfurtransferase [Staphylococcus pettenkoferi]MCY1565087.1 rhodanese-related sulfurtransferase [Staphylococcus pettenkoferi]MCY1572710.1 rhodanese-related sulfurtransferase [Staphylococcus pettenkoferi]MCY1583553.1 rhodanese-related sulfurtransferase [Staphylococcus pettenkoferi]MCY1591213.1 rhodanese-related sulfurtransferase [Staphylococcus pettenkoferi]MCY1592712.1 rhodanese-related sulfurtransferase [Staphylococcus pettenkoferi]
MDYRVLLYYKYVTIDDPETFAQEHLDFCKSLGLKGRILVSTEGLNGTLSGPVEATEKYKEHVRSDERFKDIVFKEDKAEEHAFKKMHVRPRKEIVAFDLDEDVNPKELTGKYYSPSKFKEALLSDDTIILDARNDYEYDLGHFRGAVRPDITRFRDLPDWIRNHKDELSGKKIVTYCTGGIRCEKFSGWLKREGFEDVGQLEGGIATYGKDPETQGEYWDGKMYVFDERISVDVNHVNKTVVGKEWFDGTPCERYINCSNPECNKQILVSEENEERYLGACSYECAADERNRYVKRHNISDEEKQRRLENFKELAKQ